MSLRIRFEGGPRAGELLEFDDTVERIVLGRDPRRCQVVFPADDTRVGREHCALVRVLGRYRLVVERDHVVLVDGRVVSDATELGAESDLQLGPQGPRVVVQAGSTGTAGLAPTEHGGTSAPGTRTLLAQVQRLARRGRALAWTVLALVVVLAAVAWWQLVGVKHALRLVEVHVDELSDGQRAALDELSTMKERLVEAERTTGAHLTDALASARRSVYLVVKQDRSGVVPWGTAWVVDDDALVTNAHVADAFHHLDPGVTMRVRAEGGSESFLVRDVVLHPGFQEFRELVAGHCPASVRLAGDRRATELLDACDVALLRIDPAGHRLAPPLQLASRDELARLAVGDPVGYVGYPTEGLVGVLDPERPNPITQVGRIVGLSDFFYDPGQDGDRELVKHNLPAAGGASGSPILAASGRVVAVLNAGNVVTVSGEERIPSPALINFAQRADLVGELLGAGPADAERRRAARWSEHLRATTTCRPSAADFWRIWTLDWERSIRPSRVRPVFESTVTLTDRDGDAYASRVSVPLASGHYAVVAYAFDSAVRLRLAGAARDAASRAAWWAEADVDVASSATVSALLTSPEPDSRVTLRVFTSRTASPDEVLTELVDGFAARIAPARPARLREVNGVLSAARPGQRAAAAFTVDVASGRTYLFSAMAPGGEDIDLRVEETGTPPMQDTAPDWHPALTVVPRTQRVTAFVVGPQPGTPFIFRVYGASS